MRVLFSTTANQGHFGPLIPLARAAAAAGNEVRVAASASFARSVEGASFEHLPFGDPPTDLIRQVMRPLPSLPFEQADAIVIREVFGRIDAQAAYPELIRVVGEWHPDLIVREPGELGSLAAAERAGVPHVQVAIGMAEMTRSFAEHLAEPLVELGRFAGLSGDALPAALATEPVLSSVPEVLDRAGDAQYDPHSIAFRYGGFGTTMGAFAAGLPQVVAPIFTTDQVINSRHVAAVGAGRRVEAGPDAVARACEEVMPVLDDPAYRASAAAVADAITALPSTAEAVAFLADATRRP